MRSNGRNGNKRYVPKMRETQADSFIELCFENKCIKLSNGLKLLNEWRIRKALYISYIETTVLDFQHFSRHDDTHSINILNAIELVLGKARVQQLSTSDLWLLLECAYSHDIGMSTTYDEMRHLWGEDEGFHTYVEMTFCGNDRDKRQAAEYYKQINNLIQNKKRFEDFINSDERTKLAEAWPVELAKYVTILTTDYIRDKHPERSQKFMEEHFQNNGATTVIKGRFNKIIADVSAMHGRDYCNIEKELEYCDQGFGTEYLHPQFAAVMLRLGDLLDMDNNRFNVRALEHFGELPELSELHLKKHNAVQHFVITPEKIEVTASSEDYDVCKVTGEWFHWLEDEVNNLICDWNCFVPKELKGCRLQKCKLDIIYDNSPFDAQAQKSYEVDKKSLIDLTIGSNIYESALDCIREYLQNAMDACKMKLWMDVKYNKIVFGEEDKWENAALDNAEIWKELSPFDIDQRYYDDLAIEICVSVHIENHKVKLKIADRGVGMETECVDGLAVVGKSWKQRTLYQRESIDMPEWIKPTGGYGIGLRSAFMLTDSVTIFTRSDREAEGYEIKLYSPQEKKGGVTKRRKEIFRSGTTAEFEVSLDKFYGLLVNFIEMQKQKNDDGRGNKEKILRNEELFTHFDPSVPQEFFSQKENTDYICEYLRYYVQRTIPNTLFPIVVKGGDMPLTYRSPYARPEMGFGKMSVNLVLEGRYLCHVSKDDCSVRIWDKEKSNFVCVKSWNYKLSGLNMAQKKLLNPFAYKNVRVWNLGEKEEMFSFSEFLSVSIDIMGEQMKKVVSVQRNSFSQEYDITKWYIQYRIVYIKAICKALDREILTMDTVKRNIHIFLFVLMAVQIMNSEDARKIITKFEREMESPPTVGIKKWVEGKFVEEQMNTKEAFVLLAELLERGRQDGEICFITDDIAAQTKSNLISQQDLGINEISSALNIKFVKQLKHYLENNGIIYTNLDISQTLQAIGRTYSKEYFMIKEEKEYRNVYYAFVSGVDDSRGYKRKEVIDKDRFLFLALPSKSGRFIGENISCEAFNSLLVDSIPAKKTEMGELRKSTYLISPIGKAVYIDLLLEMGLEPCDYITRDEDSPTIKMKRRVKLKEFREKIVGSPEYTYLVEWVYSHQLEKERLSKEEIRNIYNRMIQDIYKQNFTVSSVNFPYQ